MIGNRPDPNETLTNDVFDITIPHAESIAFGTVLSVVVVLTLTGNSLVCLVFWRFRQLRNLTNYFVCSLAIADFLVAILRVVFVVVSAFKKRWVFGWTWCEISSMCSVLLCGASILHLCAISIERLIAIKWPLSYNSKVTRKRVLIALTYIWLQSSLLSLIPLLPVRDFAKHRFSAQMVECEINWIQDPELTVFLFIFYFFVPVNILVIAYAKIFKEVRRNMRRVYTLQLDMKSKSAFSRFKKEIKAVKTLAVVIGMFFVMWLPFFTTTTIRAFKGDEFIQGWVQRLTLTLAYANSGCNFVIYALMNAQYRKAFSQVLMNFSERRLLNSCDGFTVQMKTLAKSLKLPPALEQNDDEAFTKDEGLNNNTEKIV